jgi:hypothetical protein
MQTIRRLYFYTICLVSMEVVLWGSIGLLRSLFNGQEIGGNSASRLAGALSLILVGIPVFLIHWRSVRLSLKNDPEERSTRIRAIFLYGILLLTLIPVVQNALSLLGRLFLQAFSLNSTYAIFGANQAWSDNFVAMLANSMVAYYFYRVLQGDWASGLHGDNFAEVRRLYRYIWMIYSLVLAVAGIQQLLKYVLTVWGSVGGTVQAALASGLALLIIGAPIWLFVTRLIQSSLADPAEKESLMRLAVLYAIVFCAVIGSLASVAIVIFQVLRVVFGAHYELASFFGTLGQPLSMAVPFAMIWTFYGRTLNAEIKEAAVPAQTETPQSPPEAESEQVQKAGLRRLYYYVLAIIGLAAFFTGLWFLFSSLIDLAVGAGTLGLAGTRNQLAGAISALLVGLPLWLVCWRPMAKEALREGEAGDHARRSLTRKIYLYLILFAGVLGVMFSAGALLYQILRALLGDPAEQLTQVLLQQAQSVLLFAGLLAFHGQVLRSDGRLAEKALSRRHAQFPLLILAPDEGAFGEVFCQVFQKELPDLPVAVHPVGQGAPDASLAAARALIFPADLFYQPSESLKLWLQNYHGERLAITMNTEGLYWVPTNQKSLEALAHQSSQVVRRLAEGQGMAARRENSAFIIVVYIFAGLFALELTLGLVSFIGSLIFQ